MLLSKFALCDSKKSKVIKQQGASELLSRIINTIHKMNKIVNKLLLAADKYLPKMHLRQPGFMQNACGQFTKNKERIQKFRGKGHSRYIYQNELDKACFQHDMVYGDSKYLTRRTDSD